MMVSYIATNLYIMTRGIYLDGSSRIWINGHLITQQDKVAFTTLLNSLEKYHIHVKNEPTYTISFSGRGDFDPRHLHLFRDKGLLYQGCLLGLEGGLDLEGYKLTKEADMILERLDNRYSL